MSDGWSELKGVLPKFIEKYDYYKEIENNWREQQDQIMV